MSLSEARFHDLLDDLQRHIEDVFDASALDVDSGKQRRRAHRAF
jgi:CyaY protein